MTTRLIVARHGNTFNKGETPTRVGAHTDLHLVPSGLEQGELIGKYLRAHHMEPDVVYAAPLCRTMETARAAGYSDIRSLDIFTEIDYGPDENKPEDEVVARIGQDAIDAWNKDATVPPGWKVDVNQIIQNWMTFAGMLTTLNQTTLVVSSNGIIRFLPYITGNFDAFAAAHDIKVGTGRLCIFDYDLQKDEWVCKDWNLKPVL